MADRADKAGIAKRRDTVECRTPTPGKKPTRIDRAKYDAVRAAILKVMPRSKAGLPFAELPERVGEVLGPDARRTIGSIAWYTTTVKLEMEVAGELERVPGATPQHLRRKR